MQEGKVHVLALTPRQQLTLRILLYNLYCGFLDKVMKDVYVTNSDETYKIKAQVALTTFERYNQIVDLLANRSTFAKARPKILTIAPIMMKNIMVAVHGFDEANCYLEKEDISYVKSEFKSLDSKVTESIKHLYTLAEIEVMKNKV